MSKSGTQAKNNDDKTTMNQAVPGHRATFQSSTTELPPGPGQSGHTGPGGGLGPQNYSRGAAARDAYADRRRYFSPSGGISMAKQSFKDECDINTIMARYQRTGVLDHVRQNVGQYIDVTGADFTEAQNLIAGARSMFNELPAKLRERFNNEPAELLSFLEKEENREEAVKLGLLNAKGGEATPLPTPPATPAPAGSTQVLEASAPKGDPAPPTPPKGATA